MWYSWGRQSILLGNSQDVPMERRCLLNQVRCLRTFFYSTLRTLKNKRHRHEGPRTSHEESWGVSSWTSQEILYSPPANSLSASWSDRTLKRVNHRRVIWFTYYWHIKETIYYHEWGWLDSQLFPFWGPGFCVTPKGHVEAAFLDGMQTGVWSPRWKYTKCSLRTI